MSDTMEYQGMGWLPDLPDFRDYTAESKAVSTAKSKLGEDLSVHAMLTKIGVAKSPKAGLVTSIDWRSYCSPVENQLSIGSCTAHAGVGMVEYYERRAFGRHIDASRLFLYKVTRNLLGWTGDTGAYLRSTMGALTVFGVPPERYYPYAVADYDNEPSAFLYAFAQSFQAISYYRLDPSGVSRDALLARIKTNLAAGLPSMFGFTVYSSIRQAGASGEIPFPIASETVLGGHAIMAVGYDDAKKIKNTSPAGTTTTGALLIRNSWGTSWGDGGYGWLPYEYVLRGLAVDWWSLIKKEWVNTQNFGL